MELSLEMVDQISPAISADIVWHYLAMRPVLNPRIVAGATLGPMIRYVATFDRDLARTLLVTARSRRARENLADRTKRRGNSTPRRCSDPSGAIAAVEKLPVDPDHLLVSGPPQAVVTTTLVGSRWRSHLGNGRLEFLSRR